VNAIRSGYPFNVTSAPQIAAFYVDTRILPGANPMDVREELRAVLRSLNVSGEVELYLYRPGFEAKGAELLIETIKRSHAQTFPTPPAIVADAVTSMWRDTNAFNELGIPAVSYAPRAESHAKTKSFKVKDLTDAALAYARIALDLCGQDRPANVPLGAHINRGIAASAGGQRVG
jgi:acetylornithine deacetylase/succinyl-diaminopimelate desuccinylase-like protein